MLASGMTCNENIQFGFWGRDGVGDGHGVICSGGEGVAEPEVSVHHQDQDGGANLPGCD